ncbi:MAG: TIGR02710 family CRISPR-associated protein [Deltaproteobacteria bacterium]|nr:TIGR02710 family CRISPR-associated protein [Deltaproteobacteria bacterium]
MDLEEKIACWQSMREHPSEFQAYYWQEIFPEARDRFVRKSSHLSKYRFLISTVGLSPEPIIFFLCAIQPEKALLICTPDSERHLDRIAEKSGLSLSRLDKKQVGSTDVVGVYQAIKDFVSGKPSDQILIDATGGKKPVIGAAVLAGNFLGIDVGYSDYTEYLQDLRLPKPGTEFAKILENPLVVFADLEIRKAKEAINSLNFPKSEEILEPLEHKVENVWLIRTLKTMARAYACIDSFHFEEAKEQIRDFFALKHRRDFPSIEKSLRFYSNILPILQDKDHEKHYPLLSLHLLFSGFRFAKRGRYDVAVFLMYRVIELVLSALLKENYGLDPADPDYSRVTGLDKEAYNDKSREVFEKYVSRPLPSKIGLMDQAIMLNILEEEVSQFVDLKKLKGIIELRNTSIFTHGTRALEESDFNRIKRMAQKLLDSYLQAKGLGTAREYRADFEFPQV